MLKSQSEREIYLLLKQRRLRPPIIMLSTSLLLLFVSSETVLVWVGTSFVWVGMRCDELEAAPGRNLYVTRILLTCGGKRCDKLWIYCSYHRVLLFVSTDTLSSHTSSNDIIIDGDQRVLRLELPVFEKVVVTWHSKKVASQLINIFGVSLITRNSRKWLTPGIRDA